MLIEARKDSTRNLSPFLYFDFLQEAVMIGNWNSERSPTFLTILMSNGLIRVLRNQLSLLVCSVKNQTDIGHTRMQT
jgi:hypothetical protein